MEISTTGAERTVWLTSPAEIEPHLVFLAVEVGTVTVVVDQLVVQGRVLCPSIARFVPFAPDSDFDGLLPPPQSQVAVRVDYQAWDESYTFHTRVVGLDAQGHWLLMPPRAIERGDRRIVYRHRVMGDTSFRLRLEGPWQPKGEQPFALFDISTDGMAFLYDPSRNPMENGEILSGHVEVGDTLTLSILLRVAHTRLFKEGAPEWVAGARYLDLGLEDRMNLARAITVWELKRQKE